MIILKDTKINFKKNIQNQYNKLIFSIDFSQINCSCNHHEWKQHCRYKRYVDFFGVKIKILILRIRCDHCGKTHAILIHDMIPFSSINHSELIAIVNHSIFVESSYLAYLKKKFSSDLLNDYHSICLISARSIPLILISLNL